MSSQLESLRRHTTVVADTGDFEAMRALRPTDATTNPSLILKAVQKEAYRPLLEQVVRDHRRSEEHTSELQSLMRISYAVFCLKKQKTYNNQIKSLITRKNIHSPDRQMNTAGTTTN